PPFRHLKDRLVRRRQCRLSARSNTPSRQKRARMLTDRERSVADFALPSAANTLSDPAWMSRAKALRRLRISDQTFFQLTRFAAYFVLVLLGAIIVSLFLGALPAFREFGFGFLISQRWNPVTEQFGALAPIYGTVVTSFIAILIAVPLGLLI